RMLGAKSQIWFLQTALGLLLLWAALNGLQSVWVGALFAFAGAAVGVWLVPTQVYPWRPLRLLGFFLFFVQQSVAGGLDVAWRALSPRLAINPRVVHIQLALPQGLPRSIMVLVTSLLPGSLSVHLDNTGRFEVHALTEHGGNALAELERRIAHVFSLDNPSKTESEDG